MKIAIIDEMRDRGKSIRYCIENIFKDADFTEILEQNASGPQARAEIPNYADQYDYIFVHHGQLDLAEQLSDTPPIILYTSYYQESKNMDETWIRENVSVNKGVSIGAILKAMMRSIGETQMIGVSITTDELSGWHALASPNLKHREGHIQEIEKQHGAGQNTNEYRRLFLLNPEDAFRFAEAIKSAIKNRGSKDDQSLRYFQSQEYAKREFKVLFVDDNEENYILLEKKLKQYLLDNDEPFEIKIIHSLTTEKLETQLKELQNVQAVIFDDRFPTDVNITEIIEKLVAIRPNIPFYIFGSDFPIFINGKLQDNILLNLPNVYS
jgi:CheY-like chemotaxis protein